MGERHFRRAVAEFVAHYYFEAAQTVDRVEPKNVAVAQVTFKGQRAIRVTAAPNAANATSHALVRNVVFRDGSIEVDLAAQPAAGAGEGARGFIGVAFRLQADGRPAAGSLDALQDRRRRSKGAALCERC